MWYLCPGLLPPPAPHLHSRSCSELEASEGEDDVQERGHGKSSNSQAAAAALFVLKTNIRAATIAHFVAVPSAQCCRLRWQNRATGADSGFLTPRAAAAAGEPSSEAPKSTSWKITWPHFFLFFPTCLFQDHHNFGLIPLCSLVVQCTSSLRWMGGT